MKRAVWSVLALMFVVAFSIPAYAGEPVQGTYINKSNPREYLTLNADMTFFLKQESKPFDPAHPYVEMTGTYVMDGAGITLLTGDGGSARGKVSNGVFEDGGGQPWIKQGVSKPQGEIGPPKRIK